ncbi:hypothetical protein KY359_05095, partial [Candidatus Woesearchaeota archaeon]|nr:hypothetical protein [Candidatus Woesearchaeota archaeon]
QTRVYRVREDLILHAYDILSRYVDCEPSGAAGLALYMQRWEKKLIGPETHCLIINTGRGI